MANRSTVPQIEELRKIETVAAQLEVTTRTVRQYIAEGRLPAFRLGDRLIRVRQSDVDALLRPIPTMGNAS